MPYLVDTEPINIHNEYLLKRCIKIMKVYKFEKLIIEHILHQALS